MVKYGKFPELISLNLCTCGCVTVHVYENNAILTMLT